MDPDRRLLVAGGLLVAATAAVSAFAYPEMPTQMASHWNAAGEVDGTMSRELGLALFPALAALTLGFFLVLPRIDPRDSYEAFRDAYDAIALATVALLGYVHVVVVLFNADYSFGVLQALAPAIGGVFVVAGYVTARADQNWFVGARTPWTLEDEEVWERTNATVARLLYASGVLAALGVLVPEYAIYLIAGPAVVLAVFTFGYSYWLYQRIA